MFSLALGHMQTCEQQGTTLLVDWCLGPNKPELVSKRAAPNPHHPKHPRSSEELLYRGPPGEPNVPALQRLLSHHVLVSRPRGG